MQREKIVEKSDSTENPSINGRYHRFNVKLGKGAFKEVYKAFDTQKQIDVAWNSIDLSLVNTEDERNKIFKECKMLRRLNHPNILKITNQWLNDKTDKLCFITNIVHDGSLAKFFRKRQVNLLRVKQISKQILQALLYLHGKGVIHRDLKCDNIFIEGNTGKVVLGDLGLSCNVVSARSIVGTPHWMAPELYREDYDEMVDIWSFGMCVLELITSLIPYSECKGAFQVYQNITAGNKPEILQKINDPAVKAFINICLNALPRMRPSAKELLDHPFLYRKLSDTTLCSQLMIPKNTEPKPTKTEQKEEEMLQQSLRPPIDNMNKAKKNKANKKNKSKKNRHYFRPEPATSPPPPSNLPASALNIESSNTLQKPVKSKREKVDIKKVKNNGDTIRIKLQIVCAKFSKPMNVEFDFSHKQEEAASVAMEMTRDLELPTKFTDKVEKAIRGAIAKAKKQKKVAIALPNKSNVAIDISSTGNEGDSPLPKLETKSRPSASFTATFLGNNGVTAAKSNSASPMSPKPAASPMSPKPAAPNIKQRSSDPMYAKPSNRIYGFNEAADYLTQSPQQQQQQQLTMSNNNNNTNLNAAFSMPMIRNQCSPDPPPPMNGYYNNNANQTHNHNVNGYYNTQNVNGSMSISNGLDDNISLSSLGSQPQPNSSNNCNNCNNIAMHQLMSTQSVPQQNYAMNNEYIQQYPQQIQQQFQYAMSATNVNGGGGHIRNQSPSTYQQFTSQINAQNALPQNVNAGMVQRQRGLSSHSQHSNGSNIAQIGNVSNINGTSIQRSSSQQSNASTKSTSATPKLPPVPEPKTVHAGASIDTVQQTITYTYNNNNITNTNNPNQPTTVYRSISPPKSTTPPTPPPVIGIQGHNEQPMQHQQHAQHRQPLHNLNNNNNINNISNNTIPHLPSYTNPKSRSPSPAPQLMHNNSDTSHKSNKSDKTKEVKEKAKEKSGGLIALDSLNKKSSATEIFRVTLKLTVDELIQEFVKRNKPYNKSDGKNGLARKLVNILKEEVKEMKDTKEGTTSPVVIQQTNLEIPHKKEQTPDSVFSMKSASVESMISIDTAEKLNKKRDSGRESALRLTNYDSGNSNENDLYDYNKYTNKGDMHNRTGTTVVHPSYATLPTVVNRQLSNDKKRTLAVTHQMSNGHALNGHVSNYSSDSNMSNMSRMTMGSSFLTYNSSALGYGYDDRDGVALQTEPKEALPSVNALKLPFEIEELLLPSASNDIVFDGDVLNQISIKQLELHNEYIDFVKRKYELLQLRFATLEAEYKDDDSKNNKNGQFIEIKIMEENGIKDKINKKRNELQEKFGEWLSDREQIAQLKSRIEKKRSTSTSADKLPAFDAQLEFENDAQFKSLMASQLSEHDKRECKIKIQSYRKEMMDNYKKFYVQTLQIYKDKQLKMQQM